MPGVAGLDKFYGVRLTLIDDTTSNHVTDAKLSIINQHDLGLRNVTARHIESATASAKP